MLCQIIKPFNRRGELQPLGSIIEVPEEMILTMSGYVQIIADDGYCPDRTSLPHYCQTGDSWCGGKLPGKDYPTLCYVINCEYLSALEMDVPFLASIQPDRDAFCSQPIPF
jgi:hypothetical protein